METIGIIFLTGFLGYQIANSKNETIRNVSEKDNGQEDMPEIEKPNSLNIYNSNKVNDINDQMLQMSMDKYADSNNPSVTGVLPPIYNSYSVAGNNNLNLNEILAKDPSLQAMSDINDINRYTDPIKKLEPELTTRPMFSSAYDNELPQDFSNFGQSTKQDVSLLTGKILDKQHINMVPFFGSNVTQNVEQFANVATLDNFTGNTDTFFHKKEQAQRFDNVKQNIYGTPANIQQERYIPSLYKQGEKPFNEIRVNAPIANTGHNPINAAAADFKTIDQLRTTNNPQISYEGIMKSGQLGSVRGISGVVNKNRVDTHFELGQDRLFTDTGHIKEQSQVNFTNMQNTTRQSQNLEYYGSAVSKESLKTEPRYTSVDNSSELSILFQEPIRQQFDNDYTRNVNRSNMANNSDYGKGSYKLPELERDSTSTMHTINVNKQGTKSQVGVLDDLKNTMKETTLIQDHSGHINSFINKSDNTGMTDYDFKTTQKEIDIDKTYIGQPMKKDQTGYNVSKYSAKTTNKETTSDILYQGGVGANDGKSNSMVYSTYNNPEKVRNAVHPKNYKGNATTQGFTQNENRQQYVNAEVNLNQEKLISNERPSGPQAFNISGGVNTVGDLNYRQNTLLKGEENRHLQNKDNISSNIPTQKLLGNITQSDNNQFSENPNTRETNDFKNLIVNQLADNPFYNLR